MKLWTDQDAHDIARFVQQYHSGAEKATTNGSLAGWFGAEDVGTNGRPGVPGSKAISELLQRCRELGYPIVCDSRGVFYALTPTEMQGHIDYWAAIEQTVIAKRTSMEALLPQLVTT